MIRSCERASFVVSKKGSLRILLLAALICMPAAIGTSEKIVQEVYLFVRKRETIGLLCGSRWGRLGRHRSPSRKSLSDPHAVISRHLFPFLCPSFCPYRDVCRLLFLHQDLGPCLFPCQCLGRGPGLLPVFVVELLP